MITDYTYYTSSFHYITIHTTDTVYLFLKDLGNRNTRFSLSSLEIRLHARYRYFQFLTAQPSVICRPTLIHSKSVKTSPITRPWRSLQPNWPLAGPQLERTCSVNLARAQAGAQGIHDGRSPAFRIIKARSTELIGLCLDGYIETRRQERQSAVCSTSLSR